MAVERRGYAADTVRYRDHRGRRKKWSRGSWSSGWAGRWFVAGLTEVRGAPACKVGLKWVSTGVVKTMILSALGPMVLEGATQLPPIGPLTYLLVDQIFCKYRIALKKIHH